jgi:hypothetical protein
MTNLSDEYLGNKIIYTGNDDFSYGYYKKLVNKYRENDCREINFQNRVIVPFLEKLFINVVDISIVDVSMQYKNKNSKIHDTSCYSSQQDYAAPPDLLIAHNWNYANKNNKDIDYLTVIEIKSPVLNSINDEKRYIEHTRKEVKFHLEANFKVILTDCIRWNFFEREQGVDPIQIIDLLITEDNSDEWKHLCDYILEFSTEKIH